MQADQPAADQERKDLSTDLAMGGQAVIEGVLMRSPFRVAVAVRKPDGQMAVKSYPYIPVARRFKSLGLPVIRGAATLVESLKIGIEALNWSAEQASQEPGESSKLAKARDKAALTLSILFATGVALGLFVYFPLWVGRLVAGGDPHVATRQIIVNVVAGVVRVAILLLYLWAVSRWKEIRRVFQYHGSEHKSIFAFESGQDLTVDRVLGQTRFHPRCGTSFLLIVALSAIVFFVIVDSIIVAIFGEYPSVLARFCVHLPLIPVLAGISYEVLKYSAKNTDNRLVRALIQPGLWLQRITTGEPDSAMCEVALTALETALDRGEPRAELIGQAAAGAGQPA
jgi:uncharacterized protein YqhQ